MPGCGLQSRHLRHDFTRIKENSALGSNTQFASKSLVQNKVNNMGQTLTTAKTKTLRSRDFIVNAPVSPGVDNWDLTPLDTLKQMVDQSQKNVNGLQVEKNLPNKTVSPDNLTPRLQTSSVMPIVNSSCRTTAARTKHPMCNSEKVQRSNDTLFAKNLSSSEQFFDHIGASDSSKEHQYETSSAKNSSQPTKLSSHDLPELFRNTLGTNNDFHAEPQSQLNNDTNVVSKTLRSRKLSYALVNSPSKTPKTQVVNEPAPHANIAKMSVNCNGIGKSHSCTPKSEEVVSSNTQPGPANLEINNDYTCPIDMDIPDSPKSMPKRKKFDSVSTVVNKYGVHFKGLKSKVIPFEAPFGPNDLNLKRKCIKSSTEQVDGSTQGPSQTPLNHDPTPCTPTMSLHIDSPPPLENEILRSETMDEAENPIPDVGPVRRERRKRGLNRNSRLEKLVRAYYDPAHPKKKFRPTITIPEHETGPIGEESIGFARELGIIVRQQAPVRIKSWMYIQQKDLEKLLESVADAYILEWKKPHVVLNVIKHMGRLYSIWRSRCKEHYLEHGGGITGRENPTPHFRGRKEDWLWLCDNIFDNEEWQESKTSHKNSENRAGVEYVHKMGSKSFPQMRHERINAETHELPGSIEMFGIAYSNKRGGLQNLPKKDMYNKMMILRNEQVPEEGQPRTEEDIIVEVCNKKSGYLCGRGRRLISAFRKRDNSIVSPALQEQSNQLEAAKEVIEAYKAEIETAKLKIDDQQNQIEHSQWIGW
ncbi:hypothetical protein OROHE_021981 [Orobanche hederae]